MSELKISISQLENLLDRQKDIVMDKILNDESCEDVNQGLLLAGKTRDGLRLDVLLRSDYPHDFNILKRYVK